MSDARLFVTILLIGLVLEALDLWAWSAVIGG